ncbi:unnamed protein product [Umbelopsis vinacea]
MAMESEELDIYDIYGDSLGLFGEAAVAQGNPGNVWTFMGASSGYRTYLEEQESDVPSIMFLIPWL